MCLIFRPAWLRSNRTGSSAGNCCFGSCRILLPTPPRVSSLPGSTRLHLLSLLASRGFFFSQPGVSVVRERVPLRSSRRLLASLSPRPKLSLNAPLDTYARSSLLPRLSFQYPSDPSAMHLVEHSFIIALVSYLVLCRRFRGTCCCHSLSHCTSAQHSDSSGSSGPSHWST